MNYNGATMANGIVTQMLGGANAQLRERLLAAQAGPGGTLTSAQTDALAHPIEVTSRSVNAIGREQLERQRADRADPTRLVRRRWSRR